MPTDPIDSSVSVPAAVPVTAVPEPKLMTAPDLSPAPKLTPATFSVPFPSPFPVPLPITVPVIAAALDIDALTTAFLARFPALPGVATRIGDTCGGTTEETKVWGRTNRFPGAVPGAPMRLAIPVTADRVGLEYSPDRKIVLLRVHSPWNEGGWHDTYITPEGQVVGGMFDVPFPRQDYANRTPANQWEFGTGFWIDGGLPDGGASDYRENLPFIVLKQGADSGVKGYTWQSSASGLVITTPTTTIYGLVSFSSAVFDPADESLCFTQFNSFTLEWRRKEKVNVSVNSVGDGKEVTSFLPSYDFDKYPTDPRRIIGPNSHPGPIKAVRVGTGGSNGGELYVFSGENDIMVHRWDAASNCLVPVAMLCVRPDGLPESIPGRPSFPWGQGAICRAGNDGNFAADRWQVFNAGVPIALWNGYLHDVDPVGNLYFLPTWGGDGAVWKTFDLVRGVFSVDNIKLLPMPDALKTAHLTNQVRIDWQTGDLVALVDRGQGQNWCLERYPDFWNSTDPAGIKAAYTSGTAALSLRTQYPWWSAWSEKWGCSPDPIAGVPTAGFGSMAIAGGFIFIAEAQAGGVRVHRLSDGSIVGRMADRLHTNSTLDIPTQFSVQEGKTEFRVCVMDFHGKSVLVWRITKKALAA